MVAVLPLFAKFQPRLTTNLPSDHKSSRRLQIPPLRSCGAPVGMTRVGRLRSGRIATRMDGVRSGYSAKTADFDRQSFSALIDGLRFVCPPSVCPPSV
jgi:hypothetical protein